MTQVLLAAHPSANLSHPQAIPAHMAYRIGPGPKLLGMRLPPQLRGGVMLLGLAVNMLNLSKERLRVGNMLPALFLPLLYLPLSQWLAQLPG